MRKTYIFHPFFFTIYAVLAPMAQNIDLVGFTAIRALVVAVLLSMILVAVTGRLFKQRERAALVSMGVLALFFSFGHLAGLLSSTGASSGLWNALLLVGLVAVFARWVYWVSKKLKDASLVTNFLNIVTGVLLIFPLYAIITYTKQTSELQPLALEYQREMWRSSGVDDLQANPPAASQPLPDIYYIIVDGYTRQDVMLELYGYDNSAFIQFLEDKGFYVARESRSNYSETVRSLASSTNLSQINTILDYARRSGKNDLVDKALDEMTSILLQHNRLSDFLHQQGYTVVTFDNGYERATIQNYDIFEKSPEIDSFNTQAAFELMLVDTTLGKLFFNTQGEDFVPLQSMFDNHRKRILYTLDNLPKYAQSEGSYFVFAHVIAPHQPYVFGPNGEERLATDPFTLLDDRAGKTWQPEMYTDQVTFINKRITQAIEEILAKSDPNPIIILQADHSSRASREAEPSTELKMKLLLPILNAYYLPGVDEADLVYPTITPVNSFRLILNHYFGTQLALLDDTSYIYETSGGKQEYIDACAVYSACP